MVCRACPFECGVDRCTALGVCRASDRIEVSQAQLHYWEEPPISGTRGSGTVFFAHCNLSCRFCQNANISQRGKGYETTPDRLVAAMLRLQDAGAHNVNLVSPTHYSEQILPVLQATKSRLRVPIVWNSNGYEKVETLRRLEGLVDVFLPDVKYHSPDLARVCSSAPDYFRHASAAVLEMRRQVGSDRLGPDGIMTRGLIVRHLVLPNHPDDSIAVLSWIREALGAETRVSLMAQYYPTHRAVELPGMNRRLLAAEYAAVRRHYDELGFEEGYVQQLSAASAEYTPDFDGRGLDDNRRPGL